MIIFISISIIFIASFFFAYYLYCLRLVREASRRRAAVVAAHWPSAAALNQALQSTPLLSTNVPMLLNLRAFDSNVSAVADVVKESGGSGRLRLRLATKSLRSVQLIERVFKLRPDVFDGIMCYSIQEVDHLCRQSTNLKATQSFLVAYPSMSPIDIRLALRLMEENVDIILMIDCINHIEATEREARFMGCRRRLNVCIDVCAALPLLQMTRLGAHRSPIHSFHQFQQLANIVLDMNEILLLRGVMCYEAQVAGVGDLNAATLLLNPLIRCVKWLSSSYLRQFRKQISDYLDVSLFDVSNNDIIFNGGGSGSLVQSATDESLTELAVGSALYAPALFMNYDSINSNSSSSSSRLKLIPSTAFALQCTRYADCNGRLFVLHGGGFIASGAISNDKQPRFLYEEDEYAYRILVDEGFGEVQSSFSTTNQHPPPALGSYCLLQPAKAGEPMERFNNLLIFEYDKENDEVKFIDQYSTYRGDGVCLH